MSIRDERYAAVQVGDRKIRLHYVTAGAGGSPLLLIHGLAGSTDNWRQALPSLAMRYRVYALDLPGFGLSEAPRPGFKLTDLAEAVSAFIKAFGLNSICVVGHSIGGLVAVEVARTNQSRVDRLVLMDSAGAEPPRRNGLGSRLALRLPILTRALIMIVGLDRVFRSVLKRLVVDPQRLPAGAVAELRRGIRRVHLPPTGPAGLSLDHFLERLGQLPCPTLVLWGAEDAVFPVDQGLTIFRNLQHGQIKVIEGCGHLMPLECPEEMLGAIFEFLE